ncbi:hypothetical protein GYMLUDRAFT_45080 [Collybiopsis luxurians FD-317 M1]|uniref:Pheromone receptor n=1 Tax=Collybiopsis luxurians FD-317 M1 TaxID=944289 RepID=A0A0D0CK12_9AGAR|nr:hypothetical protein GYMLUDRAFT_45080 [Collybiopsis luxurians FD-317 M1]
MANFDYPLFPIFSFLGFLLPLIPLQWHFQAGNSGTCFYIFWASLSCLNQFVNSLIWRGNVINSAPVWCDISIRITLATTVGLPASSFCIVRRLYNIAAIKSASITHAEKRRTIITDSLICGLWPMIYLALQYIVQGHRFNIFEDIGCMPALLNSIPTYFITFSWVLLFGLASSVYCILCLRAFTQRRLELARFISTNKALSIGQYFRLMALAMTEMICTVPLTIFLIWLSATHSPISPWISIANTHIDYGRVDQYPSVLYNLNPISVRGMLFTRWASVACAFIFFAFFGFAEEARRHYALWYRAVLRLFGIKPSLSTDRGKSFSKISIKLPSSPSVSKYDASLSSPSSPPPAYQGGGVHSCLKELKVKTDVEDSLPIYVIPTSRTPAPQDVRRSILEADSRSTICFPDDSVELANFGKSFSSSDSSSIPSSPSSSTSTYSPHSPITSVGPPTHVDSAYLDAAAVALSNTNNLILSPRTSSAQQYVHIDHEEDDMSITDAYMDSRPTSLSQFPPAPIRMPTPAPFMRSEGPAPLPPTSLPFHRPFSPPSVYPVTQPHRARGQNAGDAMAVTIRTESSREML